MSPYMVVMLPWYQDNVEKTRSGGVVSDELFNAASLPLSQWLDVKVTACTDVTKVMLLIM